MRLAACSWGLGDGLVDGGDEDVGEEVRVFGVDGVGVDLDGADDEVGGDLDLDGAAAGGDVEDVVLEGLLAAAMSACIFWTCLSIWFMFGCGMAALLLGARGLVAEDFRRRIR